MFFSSLCPFPLLPPFPFYFTSSTFPLLLFLLSRTFMLALSLLFLPPCRFPSLSPSPSSLMFSLPLSLLLFSVYSLLSLLTPLSLTSFLPFSTPFTSVLFFCITYSLFIIHFLLFQCFFFFIFFYFFLLSSSFAVHSTSIIILIPSLPLSSLPYSLSSNSPFITIYFYSVPLWYLELRLEEQAGSSDPSIVYQVLGYMAASLRGSGEVSSLVYLCLVLVKVGSRLVCVTLNQGNL